MENSYGKSYVGIFTLLAILTVLLSMSCMATLFTTRTMLMAVNFMSVVYFLVSWNKLLDFKGWLYLAAMLLGMLLHWNVKVVFESPLFTFLMWANVLVLYYSLNRETDKSKTILLLFVLMFYLLECFVCIYEKTMHTYVFHYVSEFQATDGLASDFSDGEFRAHGLINHPLYNANVISIIMALILCSNLFKKKYQILLLAVGVIALWACNSRASMGIWMVILAYRMFFYDKNVIYVIISAIILYIFVPYAIEFIQNSGYFGRFSSSYDNEFSSLSRMIAFEVFAAQDWTFDKIVIGGDIVYYGNTNVGLENGVLLNLSYWGWIIGGLKTILELLLTFSCIKKYKLGDKVIIVAALWGVAFMNNNSFQPFLLIYFFVANAAFTFNSFKKKRICNENKNRVCCSL